MKNGNFNCRYREKIIVVDQLDSKIEKVPPTSLLGKAVNYTIGQWHKLTAFLKDGWFIERLLLNKSPSI